LNTQKDILLEQKDKEINWLKDLIARLTKEN